MPPSGETTQWGDCELELLCKKTNLPLLSTDANAWLCRSFCLGSVVHSAAEQGPSRFVLGVQGK